MLLLLSDEQKQHLSLLNSVDSEIAKEFCRIAVGFIQDGINVKKYQTASQKLSLEYKLVQQCIEATMNLLSESSKLMLHEVDFKDSLLTLDLAEDVNNALIEFYTENRDSIRDILSKLSLVLPHYKDLEWRFDVQLASRMLTYQTTPQILLKLYTNNGSKTTSKNVDDNTPENSNDVTILQTDPVNLVHLTHVFEGALNEMKTAHCRRIARNIK